MKAEGVKRQEDRKCHSREREQHVQRHGEQHEVATVRADRQMVRLEKLTQTGRTLRTCLLVLLQGRGSLDYSGSRSNLLESHKNTVEPQPGEQQHYQHVGEGKSKPRGEVHGVFAVRKQSEERNSGPHLCRTPGRREQAGQACGYRPGSSWTLRGGLEWRSHPPEAQPSKATAWYYPNQAGGPGTQPCTIQA